MHLLRNIREEDGKVIGSICEFIVTVWATALLAYPVFNACSPGMTLGTFPVNLEMGFQQGWIQGAIHVLVPFLKQKRIITQCNHTMDYTGYSLYIIRCFCSKSSLCCAGFG